jgi:hypothetical protein
LPKLILLGAQSDEAERAQCAVVAEAVNVARH